MEEKTPKEDSVEQSKQNIQKDAKGLFESIKSFLIEVLDFRHDTDHEACIQSIKLDISFKGATAWILIFAIFVASIGLNANSTAVVIGAMLISPLMGPILGIGMSIAINDIDTLRKSLINLSIMIVLSLITAFLFFYFFPLSEDNSELLGRVRPDIRDVLIAFFGGLALMVARTKRGTVASVIFGVAIATALMPPLCTAGYGLAQGNWSYFLGAMYLFTINTIFIALAAFLVLKLLRFPMIKYVNSVRRKRIAQLASLLAIVVMIPAIFTFVKVYKENKISSEIEAFIKDQVRSNPSFQLIDKEYNENTNELLLNFFNEVSDGERNALQNTLSTDPRYSNSQGIQIRVKGGNTKSFELITTAYQEKRDELRDKNIIIEGLNKKIDELEQTIQNLNGRIEQDAISKNEKAVAFSRVSKDAKIRYADIQRMDFANVLSSSDFINIDTIPQVTIKWNPTVNDSIIRRKERELRTWLQAELQLDTLFIKRER
jgi:uncharacterized hydrophobic protein (TIGR00271 family)